MYNRHLETFIAVADLGSFSKAAEVLYISRNHIQDAKDEIVEWVNGL